MWIITQGVQTLGLCRVLHTELQGWQPAWWSTDLAFTVHASVLVPAHLQQTADAYWGGRGFAQKALLEGSLEEGCPGILPCSVHRSERLYIGPCTYISNMFECT